MLRGRVSRWWPPVEFRRTLVSLAVSTALSLGVWLSLREPIGHAVRGVTSMAMRLAGQRPVYPREALERVKGDLSQDDHIGITVGSIVHNGKRHTRTYVMSLMRWHVNLIILPVLAASIGRATAYQRAAIILAGAPLVLVLDGCAAFIFLSLAARRIRGDELLSHTFHSSLEHGLAVYGTKILPVLVWALLYVAVRRAARSTPSAGQAAMAD